MSGISIDPETGERIAATVNPDTGERVSAEEIEAARPKNVFEQAWTGIKNLAAGGFKSPLSIAAGLEGLVGKATDKLGITTGAEAGVQNARKLIEEKIDKTLHAGQPGYELAQFTGEVVPGLAVPFEKAIPLAQAGFQAMRLPPALAAAAGRTAVNAGIGAVEGENTGHPLAGAVFGAAGSAVGDILKGAGSQVIKSYIKGGHTGAAEGLDIPWFLEQGMGGSAKTMTAKAENRLGELRAAQDAIITQKGQAPVNALSVFQDIEKQINASPAVARNLGSHPAAQAQLEKYFDDYLRLADPVTGEVPLHLAWEMKKRAGADAADLYKAARVGGDVKSKTAQGVSALVADKFNKELERMAPELTALNPEFAKLIPVSKALGRRNIIAGQHNPIGLDELAALDAGVNFMTHGNWEGGLIPIVQRLTKMPYAGQKLRQAGSLLGSPRTATLTGLSGAKAVSLLQPQESQ